jgi:hypothetical protein
VGGRDEMIDEWMGIREVKCRSGGMEKER